MKNFTASPYLLALRDASIGDSILDLGGGAAGYYSDPALIPLISSKKLNVTVVDWLEVEDSREFIERFKGDIFDFLASCQANQFDWVCAFDVIEHFPKEDGYRLLYEMERVCRRGAAIYTPNGFVRQAPSPNNPFNSHISGWLPRELRRMGWRHQTGHVGFKYLHGEYSEPTLRGNWPNSRAYNLARLILVFFPSISFAFLAKFEKGASRPPSVQSIFVDQPRPLGGSK
jgi:SAM-dependent methyltransferase